MGRYKYTHMDTHVKCGILVIGQSEGEGVCVCMYVKSKWTKKQEKKKTYIFQKCACTLSVGDATRK